ncbi:hypothetical protein GPECTOR_47g305 [Gonium pectorale]|uniref:Ubiquitin-like domain-containing protein n=1 Tax=Gonium pectorale TaxID=33097 RepID=A0A150G9K4_GONPE|nr:hypothetical protein GPECTOR_47g305 [Gonium pectorale]|eukprot:KXZ46030.1 hypothetical protein GPECTOR_47g305 [Gonium pectorale]
MRAALRSSRPLARGARGACGAAPAAVGTVSTARRIVPPPRHGGPLPSAALSPSAAATAVRAVPSGPTPSMSCLHRRRTVPTAAAFAQDAGAAAGALRRRLVAALSCGPSGSGVPYPDAGREGSAPDLPSAVVTIKLVSGGEMTIAAKPGDLVDDVMRRIEQRTGIPPDQQRLVLASRMLQGGPGVTMAGAGVRPGDKLQMVQRLQGG